MRLGRRFGLWQDIADHFGLDERITGKLQEALNTREDPGTDLEAHFRSCSPAFWRENGLEKALETSEMMRNARLLGGSESWEVMWEILEEARNPPGLTMIKARKL